MTDHAPGPRSPEAERWLRHEERLTVPPSWWVGALVGAIALSVPVALWRDPSPRLLVGLPLLLFATVAIGLAYAGWVRVVVADGVVTTSPRSFRFDVDAIQVLEVVSGPALRQERDDHAMTNRVHAPPWIHTAVLVIVELDDGRWQDYVVGTRRLDDLLRSLTMNRTDRNVPAVDEVRTERLDTSPSLAAVRQHNRGLAEEAAHGG